MNNEVSVSICCLVYNHEKYLEKALDSFLMQKTNFKYEIIIHDDASTDDTVNIIKKYEKNFPDIIRPIYQKENQYSKGHFPDFEFLYPKAKGKYIALCEGDDYWTDEYKLQKQYDVLELHKECSISTHIVRKVNENSTYTNDTVPKINIEQNRIDLKRFIHEEIVNSRYTFQTSSYFFRSKYIKEVDHKIQKFFQTNPVGDFPLMLHIALKGDIYFIHEEMSCYRLNSVSSVTKNYKYQSDKKTIIRNERHITSIKIFDEITNFNYHHEISLFIKRRKMEILYIEKNYKEMLNSKYKDLFKNYSFKRRLFIRCAAIFPFLDRIRDYKKNVVNS